MISPVIATSERTGILVKAETSDAAIVIPADGPSFRNGALGHMDMDVSLFKNLSVDAEILRP